MTHNQSVRRDGLQEINLLLHNTYFLGMTRSSLDQSRGLQMAQHKYKQVQENKGKWSASPPRLPSSREFYSLIVWPLLTTTRQQSQSQTSCKTPYES